MRFLHTADWHLGRLFHGRHLTDDQAKLLKDILYLAREEKIDALLIAGDIYDRAVPPVEAIELFDSFLSKLLLEEKIPVLFIAGNHDSGARLSFGHRLLAAHGLHVVGRLADGLAPVILEDTYGSVAFSLLPYIEPADVRAFFDEENLLDFDMANAYVLHQARAKIPTHMRSVAIAHAFLAGGKISDSERPLTVGGSGAVRPACYQGYDYVALGHLHRPQTVENISIRYSGSLMKCSFNEVQQKKSLTLVDMNARGQVQVQEISLQPPHDLRRVSGTLQEILENRTRYPRSEDYMAVSLLDKGPVLDAHAKLRTIYPNLMQIERPVLLESAKARHIECEALRKDDDELFANFFTDMTGTVMTEKEHEFLKSVLEELKREERLSHL